MKTTPEITEITEKKNIDIKSKQKENEALSRKNSGVISTTKEFLSREKTPPINTEIEIKINNLENK